jgi:hypothetical protein
MRGDNARIALERALRLFQFPVLAKQFERCELDPGIRRDDDLYWNRPFLFSVPLPVPVPASDAARVRFPHRAPLLKQKGRLAPALS